MSQPESLADDLSFSLVRGDPWFRLQWTIGLIPPRDWASAGDASSLHWRPGFRSLSGPSSDSEPFREKLSSLGPVINTVSMYEVVECIRPTPIGKRALLAIALPALLPMIPVFATQIPVKDMLLKLLKTLI